MKANYIPYLNKNLIKSKLMPLCILFFLIIMVSSCTGRNDTGFDSTSWKEEKVDTAHLVRWKLLGKGKVFNIMNGQTYLTEQDTSLGVMLLSPDYYNGDVVMQYQALALTPSSVLVTILAAADTANTTLSIPNEYDGSMRLWSEDITNYFFAFKNAPHGGTPFIARNPRSTKTAAASVQDNMIAGVYYDVEVGKSGQKLWLSVNGKTLVEMQDEEPLKGGHLALRLRGTAGLKAACLIRNMKIYTK